MKHLWVRWAQVGSTSRRRLALAALVLVGVGCGDSSSGEDLAGTIVPGCTTNCRPGSIERAVLGKDIDAYAAGRLIHIVDEDSLEVMDEDFAVIATVDLDLPPGTSIARVSPWLETSLLVTVGGSHISQAGVELWVLGPDLAVQRTVPMESGFTYAIPPNVDYVVEGAREATQQHLAVIRVSRLGEAPLWTFTNAHITSIRPVALSPDGGVVAQGSFNLDLDLGTGTVLTPPPQQPGQFVLKLDAAGNVLWLRDGGDGVFAARAHETLIADGRNVVTLDDDGAVVSDIDLGESVTPRSVLVDDASSVLSGSASQGVYLAQIEGTAPTVLLQGHQDARSELSVIGMTEHSIFGSILQYHFECEGCPLEFTVDDVTISGGLAAVRLHR